jgi:ribose 5-phosphate isomerase B
MKIFIGADHNGFEFKRQIVEFLKRSGHEVVDEGDTSLKPEDDYPQFAGRLVSNMLGSAEEEPKGILICGSGQGMCMAANRFKGIRASVCWNIDQARMARNDDDSNVLCLSARSLNASDCEAIISVWLQTPFAGASRFKRRLKELDELS